MAQRLVEPRPEPTGAFPLPAGTVTFLMTDVEGSTAGWLRAPDAMPELMRRHDAILDRAITGHGGVRPLEQGEGDSLVAVFPDASAALAAAIEAQVVLQAELHALPVRMALHTGPTQFRDERSYGGATIICCARIRNVAHGGQVLLSEATRQAIAGAAPSGVGLRDLGSHSLRGLHAPERIWQVEYPELRSDFPPLRGTAAGAPRLPEPSTVLVGRERDIAELTDALGPHRHVTVVGPGGCGKTRLALESAWSAHGAGAAVRWVDLAATNDPDDVLSALASACGLPPSTNDLVTRIADIADSDDGLLLVLDNCEHVADAVAATADRLLTTSRSIRILATSREPVGLPAEHVLRLAPLPVPPADFDGSLADLRSWDSCRLLLDRGRDAADGFAPDRRDVTVLVELCRRLDGLPLALELAAARLRTLPLAEIVAGLQETFDLLSGSAAVPRHRTLGASIEWSHRLLEPVDQIVLRRLGAFAGPFELAAAGAVAADATIDRNAVRAAVIRLVDRSLVHFDERVGRYRLLGPIQEFCRQQMKSANETRRVNARHADWFAGVAERFGAGGLAVAEAELGPDLADLFQALLTSMHAVDPTPAYRIITGIGARWHLIGRFDLMDRAATWLLGRTPSDGDARWAAAIARLAYQAIGTGRTEFGAFVDEATAIAELFDDMPSQLYLRYWPAVDEAYAGTTLTSEALLDDARAAGVDDLVMSVARNLVSVHAMCGRFESAGQLAELARSVARAAGRDVAVTESTHAFHAAALAFSGDVEGALTTLRSGEFLGLVGRPTAALVNAALGYWLRDDDLLDSAQTLLRGEAHPINAAVIARARWFIDVAAGDFGEAQRCVADAGASPLPVANCYFQLLDAQLAVALGDLSGAETLLAAATPLIPDDSPQLEGMVHLVSAQIDQARGNDEDASRHASTAMRIAETSGVAWLAVSVANLGMRAG